MRPRLTAISVCLPIVAGLAGCDLTDADPDSGTSTTVQGIHATGACATNDAAQTFTVPDTFAGTMFTSGDGSYGYLYGDEKTACSGYIVDVLMTHTSNTNPIKGIPTTPSILFGYGGPYDLPSSAVENGSIPTTENDCLRLTTLLRVYSWPLTDNGFTLTGTYRSNGGWNFATGTCSLVPQQTTPPPELDGPTTVGSNKYRFVINVMERTTWQEAEVNLYEPPPS